jgi:hypothetical protein
MRTNQAQLGYGAQHRPQIPDPILTSRSESE